MTEESSLTFTGRLRSVQCALHGIRIMVGSQHNAWIHAAATLGVVLAGLALRLSAAEWCWIVLAIMAVWFVIGQAGFKSVSSLKEHLKTWAPGSELRWAPGCERVGGEPLLWSEQEMQAFRDFLAERGIRFVLVPSG